MSEYVADDANALATALYDAVGFHAADSWATEDSIRRGHYEGMAEALLASGVVCPAAAVRAETLEQAAKAWQINGWANVLLPPSKPPAVPAIDYGQRVTDWLREQATAARAGGAS